MRTTLIVIISDNLKEHLLPTFTLCGYIYVIVIFMITSYHQVPDDRFRMPIYKT